MTCMLPGCKGDCPAAFRLGPTGSLVVHGETSNRHRAEAAVEARCAVFGEAWQAALQSLSKVRGPRTAAGS